MPLEKRRWKSPMSYTIQGFPTVNFLGRIPFIVPDEKYRAALLRLGVFEELPGNRLRYSGQAEFLMLDGSRSYIDKEGFFELDRTKLATKVIRDNLENYGDLT